MNSNLIAVILAGGVGKRFDPFTTSKPLFPFFNRPLIVHTLETLAENGITKAIIVTNKSDQSSINAINIKTLKIETVIQERPLGMADALLSAQRLLKNQPILILNATDQVDSNLIESIVNQANLSKALIVGKKVGSYFNGGYLKMKGNQVIEVIEKPGPGNQPSNLINLVFHYFPKSKLFINLINTTTGSKDDIYEQALSTYIKTHSTQAITYESYWQALKYSWHVLDMTQLFLKHRLKPKIRSGVKIAKTALVEENVYLGENVKVLEGAVIKGPSYIGDNTIVGNNSLIRDSIINNNCVVGFSSEVVRSYLGDSCWLHTNYIGDSVLESNIALGSGAVTANYRLDEGEISVNIKDKKINTNKTKLGALIAKNVRIGVNSSIMPGVKIGTNSIIGPGLVLREDVKPMTYIYHPHNLKSKPISTTIKSR